MKSKREEKNYPKECFSYEGGYYRYIKKYEGQPDEFFMISEFAAGIYAGKEPSRGALVSQYGRMTESNDECERYAGTMLLGEADGEESGPFIKEMAGDNAASVRGAAAWGLCHYSDDSQSMEILLKLLKDKDFGVKIQAASTLGHIGKKEAMAEIKEELTRYMRDERLWEEEGFCNEIAYYVLTLLGSLLKLGDDSVILEIIRFVKHPNKLVSAKPLAILREWDGEIPVGELQIILKNDDPAMQVLAAEILLKKGHLEGMEVCRRELESPKSPSRHNTIYILGHYGGAEGEKILKFALEKESDIEIQMEIIENVQSIDDDIIAYTLKDALAHHWPTVRLDAVRLLRRLPKEKAKILAEEAMKDEPDGLVLNSLNVVLG
jgi:HEAT repeat protein